MSDFRGRVICTACSVASCALILTLVDLAHAQIAASPQQSSESCTEVLFFDDFSQPTLDRSAWNIEVVDAPHNNEQQAYVDAPETLYIDHDIQEEGVTGGVLVLQPRYRPRHQTASGRTVDFLSSRINTRGKHEFTHAVMAARIKLPVGSGLWPAFWALGNGEWPDTGEIDVMEYVGEPDWVSSAMHGPGYSGETPLVNKFYFNQSVDAAGWHIYEAEWSPTQVTFRVDDQTVYRVTRTMVEHYGAWSFDSPKFLILNFALGGSFPHKVNGVESPYFGLPESTVQRIEANQARMLVDWVRVSRSPGNTIDANGSRGKIETAQPEL